MIWQPGRIDTQRRIADQQSRVGDSQHGIQIGRRLRNSGDSTIPPFQDDPRQLHRRPRARIRRQASGSQLGRDETKRMLRTGPGRRFPSPNDLQIQPRQFESGNDADIGGPGRHLFRASRRDLEIQIEQALLRPMRHSPNQRRGIQIADGAHSYALQRNRGQISV